MRKFLATILLLGASHIPTGTAAPLLPDSRLTLNAGGVFVEETKPPDFEAEVLTPLRTAQDKVKTDCEATGGSLDGLKCIPAPIIQPESSVGYNPSPQGYGGGVMWGNNCVQCVYQMTGRMQYGNAGQWQPSHSDPRVGDIMIFWPGEQGASSLGHVGVVAWTDGYRVRLWHCAWEGQIEFYSTGKFW